MNNTTRPGTPIGEVRAYEDGSVRLTVFTPTGWTVVRENELEQLRAEVAALKRLLKTYCRCGLQNAAGDGCECCNPDLAIELAKEHP